MEKLSVFRTEKKYLLGYAESVRLKRELALLLEPDPFSKNGTYPVRSLYFDTLNNKDYRQKDSGAQQRQKVRLRVYSPQDRTAKLELKAKDGESQHKSSLLLTRSQAQALQCGDTEVLLDLDDPAALEFYARFTLGAYRPAALIEYDRAAFLYPEFSTRITLDSGVRSSEMALDLFDPDVPWTGVADDRVTLEVKYDGTLYRPISLLLEKYHLQQVSFGKYAAGRPILNYYL